MNAIQTNQLSIIKNPAFKKVIVYLVLTFTLCIPFYYYIISTGEVEADGGIYVIGLMWCPGVAALLTRLIYQRNLRGMGWGWGQTRYQVWGYLVPLIAFLAVYGLTWSTGLGGFSSEALTREAGFGLPVAFAMQATLGVLFLAMFTLGEELGWRGLLVPELSKITSFTQLSLISGVIWTVYHLPILFFADYHSTAPTWYVFLCFIVEVVAFSFVYAWLRLKSGSIWPAVIIHASFNLFEGVFNQLTVDRGYTEYFTTEFGAGLAIAFVLIAYWCWKQRDTLPQLESNEPEPVGVTQAQLSYP
jgi:membrane protease YdiL (CAAX protease family)